MSSTQLQSPAARRTARPDTPPRFSALDLMPIRDGQTSHQAVAATLLTAQAADAAGYTRYWLAEHHNTPTFAITTPSIAIAHIAAQTDTIRVGSGGVMLPNHNPLVVAEQFALLEVAYPRRIDLGIGRAPGGDTVTSHFLRKGRNIERFPDDLDEVLALMKPDGLQVDRTGSMSGPNTYTLRATPQATSAPGVWLLGSSAYSASLAGSKGLPYVFDHHFLVRGTEDALGIYRQRFEPSASLDAPKTLITITAVVAPTPAEAEARALPMLQTMARIVDGEPLGALELVEDAARRDLPARQHGQIESMRQNWIVGTPEHAPQQVQDIAAEFGVDEVMINTVASAYRDEPLDAIDPRARTLSLLATALDTVNAPDRRAGSAG